MRTKGMKWAVGVLSITAIVFSIILITNNTHAQADDPGSEEGIEMTNEVENPSADVNGERNLKCKEAKEKCTKVCTPEECANCTPEECEGFCKSSCEDKKEMIEEGGC